MPKKIDWELIKRAYLASNDSYATIAQRFGVSERGIEQHASTEGWAVSREQLQPVKTAPQKRTQPTRELDDLSVIDNAIADLSAGISDQETPIRSKEAAATALVRLLEYREKLQPSTAAHLAERAIALGISPDDFLEELRKTWAQG